MKVVLARLPLALLTCTPAFAQDVLLPGYGNSPFDPICAQACLQTLRPYWLNCTDLELAKKPFDYAAPSTSPSCYGSDPAFLTSAAWCVHSRCPPDTKVAKLEAYWQMAATAATRLRTLPPPKWSYTVALGKVDPKPPKNQLTVDDVWLNETSLLPEVAYLAAVNGMVSLFHEQVTESQFR